MRRRRKPFEARLKHVAQWGDAKLPFQDARPRGAIGMEVEVVDAAGTEYRMGHIRLHDLQTRSAVLPNPRLQESSLSLRVLVGVIAGDSCYTTGKDRKSTAIGESCPGPTHSQTASCDGQLRRYLTLFVRPPGDAHDSGYPVRPDETGRRGRGSDGIGSQKIKLIWADLTQAVTNLGQFGVRYLSCDTSVHYIRKRLRGGHDECEL
jgi:hypothetical protein